MKQLKEDFEFVLQLAQEFFDQDTIVEKLKAFSDYQIKGWEIWFQVEFALFLQAHSLVAEVDREKKFKMDLRKSKDKMTCSIDFFIRQKYKHTSIPLELKQGTKAASCIRHMLMDITKFEKIRCTNFPTSRSLWCLGVHVSVSDDSIKKIIHENKVFEMNIDYVKTFEIQGTEYSFTLL